MLGWEASRRRKWRVEVREMMGNGEEKALEGSRGEPERVIVELRPF
jgi:hypothetical protein